MESRWIWPFELLDKLGEGGMGVVYRARYVGNNRIVAVKLVPDDVAANPTLLTRFERELEVLKKLKHPHIVHCFGGTCESKQRFYAMELVEGGTLHSLLREVGKLPWETVVDYGQQMCSALDFAHLRNVVHRDVKPGNFLITKNGKIKLSDFGLAIVVASQRITAAGKTLGTFHYMAPEQIRGKPPVSNKTDLYALGCVLFEMLTGNPPYDAESAAEVLHKHLKEPIPSVRALQSNCPVELDLLITDLLQKDPEARPITAAVAGERLKSIHAAPSTAVSSMSLTPTIPRSVIDPDSAPMISSFPSVPGSPPRGHNWLLNLALVFALIGLIFGQWQAWHWKSRAHQSEATLRSLLQRGSPEMKLNVIHTLGQMEAVQPATAAVLQEQLRSEDRQLRVAILDLAIARPAFAKEIRGEMARLQRGDPDAEIRQKVDEALNILRTGESKSSLFSTLLHWLIILGSCGVLAGLSWYGWIWVKQNSLIPGL